MSAAASSSLAGEKIVLVERPVGETPIDVPPKGDSVGDMVVLANPVFDATNTTLMGGDQGYCVRTVVGKEYECFWTLILSSGQITAEGPVGDSGDSLLAVTGGTGKYLGARGTLKIHSRDAKQSSYEFVYELL
jgi:hypothetical protein